MGPYCAADPPGLDLHVDDMKPKRAPLYTDRVGLYGELHTPKLVGGLVGSGPIFILLFLVVSILFTFLKINFKYILFQNL
jgi:hypothetical protein